MFNIQTQTPFTKTTTSCGCYFRVQEQKENALYSLGLDKEHREDRRGQRCHQPMDGVVS